MRAHAHNTALRSSTIMQKVPTTNPHNLHALYVPFGAQLLRFNWVTLHLKILVVLQTPSMFSLKKIKSRMGLICQGALWVHPVDTFYSQRFRSCDMYSMPMNSER